MFYLLYVSQSLLRPDLAEDQLAAIVEVSRARNAAAGITGALLFTGDHFAQVLEGDEASVTAMMHSIAADARHTGIKVLAHGPAKRRSFRRWSMAYAGRSTFAANTVTRALSEGDDYAIRNLMRLLEELSRSSAG